MSRSDYLAEIEMLEGIKAALKELSGAQDFHNRIKLSRIFLDLASNKLALLNRCKDTYGGRGLTLEAIDALMKYASFPKDIVDAEMRNAIKSPNAILTGIDQYAARCTAYDSFDQKIASASTGKRTPAGNSFGSLPSGRAEASHR